MVVTNSNNEPVRVGLLLSCIIFASTLTIAYGDYCTWDGEEYTHQLEDLPHDCCSQNSYDLLGNFSEIHTNTYSYAHYEDLYLNAKPWHRHNSDLVDSIAYNVLHDGVTSVVDDNTIAAWNFTRHETNTVYFEFDLKIIVREVLFDIVDKEVFNIAPPTKIEVEFSEDNVTYGMVHIIENEAIKNASNVNDTMDTFPMSVDGSATHRLGSKCMPVFRPAKYARVNVTCHHKKSEKMMKVCGLSEIAFKGPPACHDNQNVDSCKISSTKKTSLRGSSGSSNPPPDHDDTGNKNSDTEEEELGNIDDELESDIEDKTEALKHLINDGLASNSTGGGPPSDAATLLFLNDTEKLLIASLKEVDRLNDMIAEVEELDSAGKLDNDPNAPQMEDLVEKLQDTEEEILELTRLKEKFESIINSSTENLSESANEANANSDSSISNYEAKAIENIDQLERDIDHQKDTIERLIDDFTASGSPDESLLNVEALVSNTTDKLVSEATEDIAALDNIISKDEESNTEKAKLDLLEDALQETEDNVSDIIILQETLDNLTVEEKPSNSVDDFDFTNEEKEELETVDGLELEMDDEEQILEHLIEDVERVDSPSEILVDALILESNATEKLIAKAYNELEKLDDAILEDVLEDEDSPKLHYIEELMEHNQMEISNITDLKDQVESMIAQEEPPESDDKGHTKNDFDFTNEEKKELETIDGLESEMDDEKKILEDLIEDLGGTDSLSESLVDAEILALNATDKLFDKVYNELDKFDDAMLEDVLEDEDSPKADYLDGLMEHTEIEISDITVLEEQLQSMITKEEPSESDDKGNENADTNISNLSDTEEKLSDKGAKQIQTTHSVDDFDFTNDEKKGLETIDELESEIEEEKKILEQLIEDVEGSDSPAEILVDAGILELNATENLLVDVYMQLDKFDEIMPEHGLEGTDFSKWDYLVEVMEHTDMEVSEITTLEEQLESMITKEEPSKIDEELSEMFDEIGNMKSEINQEQEILESLIDDEKASQAVDYVCIYCDEFDVENFTREHLELDAGLKLLTKTENTIKKFETLPKDEASQTKFNAELKSMDHGVASLLAAEEELHDIILQKEEASETGTEHTLLTEEESNTTDEKKSQTADGDEKVEKLSAEEKKSETADEVKTHLDTVIFDFADTEEETLESANTEEEILESADTEEETLKIDDTEEETLEIDDTEEETVEIDDTEEETVEIDDTEEDTVEIDDTEEETVESDDKKSPETNIPEKVDESQNNPITNLESGCGSQDYIYRNLDAADRFPIMEQIFQNPIDAHNGNCPPYLCGNTDPSARTVMFYNPETDYEGSVEFTTHYREFANTMRNINLQSGHPKMKSYAVSCCANKKFCEDHIHTDGKEYPIFYFMKGGDSYKTGISAHFDSGEISGINAIDVIEGLYELLYPDTA